MELDPKYYRYFDYQANRNRVGEQAVRGLYMADRVVEAEQELAEFSNESVKVEAEARRDGTQIKLRPWLTLEVVESDLGDRLEPIKQLIIEACVSVAKWCGYDFSIPVMVTILPASYESAWSNSRWGYFVPKVKYGKICLNSHLVDNLTELKSTTAHEFMHHISATLSHDEISHWLSEGLSTYVESRDSSRAVAYFRADESAWLDPTQLEGAVGNDSLDERGLKRVSLAYSQANLIVQYLTTLAPPARLIDLLKAIGDESVLVNLENELLLRNRVDGALRHVYGISESKIFADTLTHLRS